MLQKRKTLAVKRDSLSCQSELTVLSSTGGKQIKQFIWSKHERMQPFRRFLKFA
jgi:hypothetical protein